MTTKITNHSYKFSLEDSCTERVLRDHDLVFVSDTWRSAGEECFVLPSGGLIFFQPHGRGRNGLTRNSSGAVAADSWCSEKKRGADGEEVSMFVKLLAHAKARQAPPFCKHP